MARFDIYGPFNDAPKIVVEVPEVKPGKYPEIFEAGEWSFDIRDESDPELVREAIGAWIAWYDFITKDEK